MDVQATAATATSLPPALAQVAAVAPSTHVSTTSAAPSSITTAAAAAAVSAVAGTGSPGAAGSGSSGASTNSTIGPTPGLATLPAGPPDGSKKGSTAPESTLASNVASLFNVQEQNISVSYQILQNPNEIVTVFTDKTTGKVIVQFPSETLIALAKVFDKLDGNVVNKKV